MIRGAVSAVAHLISGIGNIAGRVEDFIDDVIGAAVEALEDVLNAFPLGARLDSELSVEVAAAGVSRLQFRYNLLHVEVPILEPSTARCRSVRSTGTSTTCPPASTSGRRRSPSRGCSGTSACPRRSRSTLSCCWASRS